MHWHVLPTRKQTTVVSLCSFMDRTERKTFLFLVICVMKGKVKEIDIQRHTTQTCFQHISYSLSTVVLVFLV
uniref:Uncharacterized protein n=1 Tax=Arion vulgaris TaxID=1028688 RepID=A0A0B7BWR5_9EUPU